MALNCISCSIVFLGVTSQLIIIRRSSAILCRIETEKKLTVIKKAKKISFLRNIYLETKLCLYIYLYT